MTIEVLIGRIGKPHGVRGEVTIDVRSDEPERRFAPGSSLVSRLGRVERPLTLARVRWHQGVLLAAFEEFPDRDAAEAARGTLLYGVLAEDESPEDEDEFYDHQLVGLTVVDLEGRELGSVASLMHGAQDVLVVTRTAALGGGEGMVPFVKELVPTVDVAAGRVVVADRPGLVTPFPDDAE